MEPLSVALIGVASSVLGGIAQGLVSDVAKVELYSQLEKRAKSSTLAGALHRLFVGAKGAAPAPEEVTRLLSQAGLMDPGLEATVIQDLARDLADRATALPAHDAGRIAELSAALDGIGQLLTWFHAHEGARRLDGTHWLDPQGRFRSWTARPWFEAFDLATPWGRFLLLGLAAAWNFPRPFEDGEGFLLFLADRHRSPDGAIPDALRQGLRRYDEGVAALRAQGRPEAEVSARQAGLASDLGLLAPADLPLIAQYRDLCGFLENAEKQASLPPEVVAAINRGWPRRIDQILAFKSPALAALVPMPPAPAPTFYLDVLAGLASLEARFEALDGWLAAGTPLTTARLAGLIAELRTLRVPQLTKGGRPATVLKAKLPLVLRELRGRGHLQVDPWFCCPPDSHVRRSLQRRFPHHFTRSDAFPALNADGAAFAAARLAERIGAGELARLAEAPLAATFYDALLTSALVYFAAPAEPFLYDVPWFLHDMALGGAPAAGEATAFVPVADPGSPGPDPAPAGPAGAAPRTLVAHIRQAVEAGRVPRIFRPDHLMACPEIAAAFAASTLTSDPPNRSAAYDGSDAGIAARAQPQASPYLRFRPANDARLWFCLREHFRPGEDPTAYTAPLPLPESKPPRRRGRPPRGAKEPGADERTALTCPHCGTRASTPFCPQCGKAVAGSPAIAPGAVIDGVYEVVAMLGRGAFAVTYRVRDRQIPGKEWVAKVLERSWLRDEKVRAGFLHEASVLASLHLPGIPKVARCFEWNGQPLLLQDFIEGEPLNLRLMARGPFAPAEVAEVLRQVLGILADLHERPAGPLIHRDVKPANLIRGLDGRIWLVDFGASKVIADVGSPSTRIYTPGYAPAEQLAGGAPEPGWDLHALGMTALVLLSGLPAERAGDAVPPGPLGDVVRRMVASEPRSRYPSAREVLAALAISGFAPA